MVTGSYFSAEWGFGAGSISMFELNANGIVVLQVVSSSDLAWLEKNAVRGLNGDAADRFFG